MILAVAGAMPAWATEPAVCSGCQPPLVYTGGGLVMSTNTGGGLTVTPIFWEPGGRYKFPADYKSIIDGFVADVAAASGRTDNVFSIPTEYYQAVGGAKTPVSYQIRAGTPLVATDPLPSNGCTPASGYPACITDDQLRTELSAITSSQRLPTDLAHFYPVFLAPGVETRDRDGSNSVDGYCGYHRAFGTGASVTVYADMPYEQSNCDGGQAPNGNLVADGTVSTLSHELSEAITDPLDQVAWNDKSGHEIGDMCAQTYGPALGSTDSSNPGSSKYNQVINGGQYYLQQEFSDAAFSKLGLYNGCTQSEALAHTGKSGASGNSGGSGNSGSGGSSHQSRGQATTVITDVNDATPATLPADGESTSTIALGVSTPAGDSVVDDPVHFNVALRSGTGQCGTLSRTESLTNDSGFAHDTYTASRDNVSCWVIADEPYFGKSAEAVIYQGTLQKQSPTFTPSFPTRVQAGGSTTFTLKATNPTSQPIPGIRQDFTIFPGDGATNNVDASHVHLSYSTTGPNGTFTPVHLTGSTIKTGAIEGFIAPLRGVTLAPGATTTYTFQVALASNVPVSKRKPLLAFESYLDQINPADGTAATLADTYAYQILVPSEASTSTTLNIWTAIATALALAIGGLLIWRTARRPPQQPPPQPA
jgi:hypothetical protein